MQASLTLMSQPEGAFITEKGTGKSYGIAPVTVYYDSSMLLQHTDTDGCFLVNGFEARWVSGTTASLELIRLCGSNYGKFEIQFNRDTTQPYFEKDMHFAIQIQALRAQQKQADAAKKAADAAFISALKKSRPPKVNCTATQIGNTIDIDCR